MLRRAVEFKNVAFECVRQPYQWRTRCHDVGVVACRCAAYDCFCAPGTLIAGKEIINAETMLFRSKLNSSRSHRTHIYQSFYQRCTRINQNDDVQKAWKINASSTLKKILLCISCF